MTKGQRAGDSAGFFLSLRRRPLAGQKGRNLSSDSERSLVELPGVSSLSFPDGNPGLFSPPECPLFLQGAARHPFSW